VSKVGRQLGDFVQKATGSTKGQRALVDVQAPLVERRRAAWNGSPPASACSMELPLVLVVQDVPEGGVLFALPALLLLGLLTKSRATFSMSEGFHPLVSIFLLLALMASRPETLRVRRD
jgi:hypothetical protein